MSLCAVFGPATPSKETHLADLRERDPERVEPLGHALDGHEEEVRVHGCNVVWCFVWCVVCVDMGDGGSVNCGV